MKTVISSLQHPLVKHLIKLRGNSDYRYEHRSLVFEGSKPILEVIEHAKKLIYSETFIPYDGSNAEQWIVTDGVMKKISGLTSPEGVIAEVQMPGLKPLESCHHLLVLDGISDPGNMGTLLRTALAFGWNGVFVLPDSCDLFNEKVLRAARGAHFKIPLFQGSIVELKELILRHDLQPLLADLKGIEPHEFPMQTKKALIMGNEAHGASKDVKEFCSPVTLSISNQMESLNVAVAGGILLYLLKH